MSSINADYVPEACSWPKRATYIGDVTVSEYERGAPEPNERIIYTEPMEAKRRKLEQRKQALDMGHNLNSSRKGRMPEIVRLKSESSKLPSSSHDKRSDCSIRKHIASKDQMSLRQEHSGTSLLSQPYRNFEEYHSTQPKTYNPSLPPATMANCAYNTLPEAIQLPLQHNSLRHENGGMPWSTILRHGDKSLYTPSQMHDPSPTSTTKQDYTYNPVFPLSPQSQPEPYSLAHDHGGPSQLSPSYINSEADHSTSSKKYNPLSPPTTLEDNTYTNQLFPQSSQLQLQPVGFRQDHLAGPSQLSQPYRNSEHLSTQPKKFNPLLSPTTTENQPLNSILPQSSQMMPKHCSMSHDRAGPSRLSQPYRNSEENHSSQLKKCNSLPHPSTTGEYAYNPAFSQPLQLPLESYSMRQEHAGPSQFFQSCKNPKDHHSNPPKKYNSLPSPTTMENNTYNPLHHQSSQLQPQPYRYYNGVPPWLSQPYRNSAENHSTSSQISKPALAPITKGDIKLLFPQSSQLQPPPYRLKESPYVKMHRSPSSMTIPPSSNILRNPQASMYPASYKPPEVIPHSIHSAPSSSSSSRYSRQEDDEIQNMAKKPKLDLNQDQERHIELEKRNKFLEEFVNECRHKEKLLCPSSVIYSHSTTRIELQPDDRGNVGSISHGTPQNYMRREPPPYLDASDMSKAAMEGIKELESRILKLRNDDLINSQVNYRNDIQPSAISYCKGNDAGSYNSYKKPKEKWEEEFEKKADYNKLVALSHVDLVVNVEGFQCPLCSSDVEAGEGAILQDCLHNLCKECLAGAILFCETAAVKCPFRNAEYSCESHLREKEIKSLVTAEVYARHLQTTMALAQRQGQVIFQCKTPGCPGWCSNNKVNNIDVIVNFLCPICMHTNCTFCAAIHEEMTCGQYQAMIFRVDSNKEAKNKEYLQESMRSTAEDEVEVIEERYNNLHNNIVNSDSLFSTRERTNKDVAVDQILRDAEDKLKSICYEELDKELEEEGDYHKLLALNSVALVANVEKFECPICFLDVEVGEGAVLQDCLHRFCKECLAGTIQFCETAVVKCPFQNDEYSCESHLQEREVKSLVTAEVFERYLQRSVTLAESQAQDSFHCKTADCPGWCLIEDNINSFWCPVCNCMNCLTCSAIHEGKNCKQYQDDVAFMSDTNEDAKKTKECLLAMVDNGEAMRCPQCQVILIKKEGCAWLKCSMCQTEICWVTKGRRWGLMGNGDTSGGCKCRVNGALCHPMCNNCH